MANIGTAGVEKESGVFIYDAKTGRVLHRHEVVTLRGGTHPTDKEIEREAVALFSASASTFKGATGILHFDPRPLKPDTLYKVDVKTRALVEQPIKPRRTRG